MSGKIVLTCPHCGKESSFDLDNFIKEYLKRIDELLRELGEIEAEIKRYENVRGLWR